jgi:hypothetical protein
MASELSPPYEAFIRDALDVGAFPSREALLEAAVDALRAGEANPAFVDPEHMGAVEQAIEELEAGLVDVWDVDLERRLLQDRLSHQQRDS